MLARMDEPVWRRLHPASVAVGRRAGLILVAGIALVSLVGTSIAAIADNPPGFLKILMLAAWIAMVGVMTWLSLSLPRWRYLNTRYRVDALGLLLHRGRLFHSELGVARSRIQHTDVTQGPIQRLYGLATLSIYTAGTEDAQIDVSGIAFDEARRLRTELTGQSDDDVV
jgi:uncharacterized protein